MSLIDRQIEIMSRDGWQVVSRTETFAQLRRPKRPHRLGIVVLVIIPLILGFVWDPLLVALAVVGAAVVLLDYLLKQDELLTLEVSDFSPAPTANTAR